jgi:murein DD-endopeptidase
MTLAVCALTAHARVHGQLPPSVEFRVAKAPTVAAGDSGAFLAYELHVTNLTPATLSLRRVEVRNAADTNRVLWSVGDNELLRILQRPGVTIMPSERANVAGGSRAYLFLWVPVARDAPPEALTHRLTFKRMPPDSGTLARLRPDSATRARMLADTPTVVVAGAVTPVDRSPVRVGAPLRGEWMAANGPSNQSGHRRSALALNGTVAIAQRFGIDFLQVGESGRSWDGDSTKNASYFAYGEEIFSVGDGKVVATKDSIPENSPRSAVARAVPIDLVTVAGNHIVVDMGEGHFALYAHIQPGTLRVKVGDRVRRGQVLGLVGNSGNSTEPHLHFHIVDGVAAGTATLGAEGIPYSLAAFDVVGRCQLSVQGVQCTRIAPIPVREALPLQNQLVRFRN